MSSLPMPMKSSKGLPIIAIVPCEAEEHNAQSSGDHLGGFKLVNGIEQIHLAFAGRCLPRMLNPTPVVNQRDHALRKNNVLLLGRTLVEESTVGIISGNFAQKP